MKPFITITKQIAKVSGILSISSCQQWLCSHYWAVKLSRVYDGTTVLSNPAALVARFNGDATLELNPNRVERLFEHPFYFKMSRTSWLSDMTSRHNSAHIARMFVGDRNPDTGDTSYVFVSEQYVQLFDIDDVVYGNNTNIVVDNAEEPEIVVCTCVRDLPTDKLIANVLLEQT